MTTRANVHENLNLSNRNIMVQQSPILACPHDIVLLICAICKLDSLHNLSLASKHLRAQCLPELYRNIDLSSHNLRQMPEYEDELRLEIWASTSDFCRPDTLVQRQRAFLPPIVEHPWYASWVRVFSWTLIQYNSYLN